MHIIHFKVGVIDLIDLIGVYFFYPDIQNDKFLTVNTATGKHMVISLI